MKMTFHKFSSLAFFMVALTLISCAATDTEEGTGDSKVTVEGVIAISQALNLTTNSMVSTFTGDGTNDSINGDGVSASHSAPHDICTDGTNLYVVDKFSPTVRKIGLTSPYSVTTIAGKDGFSGTTDGTGDTARFNQPAGITTDGTYLYIADQMNYVIRKITIASGYVMTLSGTGSYGSTDGSADTATFASPTGITYDGSNLYVADMGSHLIRQVNPNTGYVTTIAGGDAGGGTTCDGTNDTNCKDGAGTAAEFKSPHDIATDGDFLYVIDQGNNRIRKINIATTAVTTLAGTGAESSFDGSKSTATLDEPEGIATDGTYVYFTDWGNGNTYNSVLRKTKISDGTTETISGSGTGGSACIGGGYCYNGAGSNVQFNWAHDLATDGNALYLADFSNNRIRKIENASQ